MSQKTAIGIYLYQFGTRGGVFHMCQLSITELQIYRNPPPPQRFKTPPAILYETEFRFHLINFGPVHIQFGPNYCRNVTQG
jgi:hypothetical protein